MAWKDVSLALSSNLKAARKDCTIKEREEHLRCIEHETAQLQSLREREYHALQAHKERIEKRAVCFIGRLPSEILIVSNNVPHHSLPKLNL